MTTVVPFFDRDQSHLLKPSLTSEASNIIHELANDPTIDLGFRPQRQLQFNSCGSIDPNYVQTCLKNLSEFKTGKFKKETIESVITELQQNEKPILETQKLTNTNLKAENIEENKIITLPSDIIIDEDTKDAVEICQPKQETSKLSSKVEPVISFAFAEKSTQTHPKIKDKTLKQTETKTDSTKRSLPFIKLVSRDDVPSRNFRQVEDQNVNTIRLTRPVKKPERFADIEKYQEQIDDKEAEQSEDEAIKNYVDMSADISVNERIAKALEHEQKILSNVIARKNSTQQASTQSSKSVPAEIPITKISQSEGAHLLTQLVKDKALKCQEKDATKKQINSLKEEQIPHYQDQPLNKKRKHDGDSSDNENDFAQKTSNLENKRKEPDSKSNSTNAKKPKFDMNWFIQNGQFNTPYFNLFENMVIKSFEYIFLSLVNSELPLYSEEEILFQTNLRRETLEVYKDDDLFQDVQKFFVVCNVTYEKIEFGEEIDNVTQKIMLSHNSGLVENMKPSLEFILHGYELGLFSIMYYFLHPIEYIRHLLKKRYMNNIRNIKKTKWKESDLLTNLKKMTKKDELQGFIKEIFVKWNDLGVFCNLVNE